MAAQALVVGGLWVVLAAIASGCGGPTLPAEAPEGSPLAAGTESAPLPEIGASFEDPEAESEADEVEPGAHGHAH